MLWLVLVLRPALSSHAEQKTVRLGIVAPLSGPLAPIGFDLQRGLILASEETEGTSHKYELIFEDNGNEAKKSVSAAQKLIVLNKVDVLITLWAPATLAVAPLAESRKIPLYGIQWDPEIGRRYKYTLAHQVTVERYVERTTELLAAMNWERINVIRVDQPGFNKAADLLRQQAARGELSIVTESVVQPGQRDFRAEILRAKSQTADGYILWGEMPEIELLIEQVKQVDPKADITGFFDGLPHPEVIENILYVSEANGTKAFEEAFAHRFRVPFLLKAPNAYDIFKLIVMGYESTPETKISAETLIERLSSVRGYAGAVGLVDIDEFGNSSYEPTIKMYRKGGLVAIP